MRALLIILLSAFAAAGSGLLFRYGTLTPCGILKQCVREKLMESTAQRMPASGAEAIGFGLGLTLAGSMLDNAISSLSPSQCARKWFRIAILGDNLFDDRLNSLSTVSSYSSSLSTQHPLNPVPQSKPTWDLSTRNSPIDDSKIVVLTLMSEDEIGPSFSRVSPTLVLRCQESKTEAYINFDRYMGFEDIQVIYRFDKDPARNVSWSSSTDRKAGFIPKPILFIKELQNHQTLLVRVIPPNDSPADISFDIAGLTGVIAPLKEACAWK